MKVGDDVGMDFNESIWLVRTFRPLSTRLDWYIELEKLRNVQTLR